MKIICILILQLLFQQVTEAKTVPDERTFEQIATTYKQLLEKLNVASTELASSYSDQPARDDYFLQEKDSVIHQDIWMTLSGQIDLTFFKDPLILRSFANDAIERYLKDPKHSRQLAPHFTTSQAVDVARDYLAKLGYQLPTDYHLGEIRFGGTWHSCWEVRWWRVANGIYPQDQFDPVGRENVCVVFHETLGLYIFGYQTESPPPKSLEVKISREDAILKASKVAPLVERTSFYKESRVGGFVVKSLEAINLQVVVPNWLLDPARATLVQDRAPEETRLSWVVRFSTVSDLRPEAGIKPIAPEIIIYIDAATGEVIGANFK